MPKSRATSIQPLERQAALQVGSGHGDEAAERALSCLITVNLVREVVSEDGRAAVFNPNIWIGDSEMVTAALRTEDARVQREVGALIEEIMASPGIPEEHVTSTEQRWIDFAVSAGLVERSQVVAASDKKFLFTPHLHRDPFGTDPRDPSGHIRQLVGSGSPRRRSTWSSFVDDVVADLMRRLIATQFRAAPIRIEQSTGGMS